ncbi:DUF3606 domain-containing protein [Piscinibacter gummiphilus]|jgi:hypothetical protein|uniref:DUF3606 domain-containing protein n=1 Tax=Piscinibacter gummiphilus TaxID=946333 RepID=UPI000A269F88|nr:DUF3606 domain-containing protein [Piscinibacter gummiphilus]ATU67584.1 DUF3606 domain-containing protein [Piscinibacter gummiphilus]GLS96705.1 hypothetical protein GCM10007918_39970 [Piscinibacter gummiphilus]
MPHLQNPHPHADHIDVRQDEDVAYWTQTLGVSEEELRRTVAEVGDEVDAVTDRHPAV